MSLIEGRVKQLNQELAPLVPPMYPAFHTKIAGKGSQRFVSQTHGVTHGNTHITVFQGSHHPRPGLRGAGR